jgi:arylsulfatase A-like enzyme
MNARFLALLAAGFSLLGASFSSSAAPPPNIVYILADDLGYGDVGCYGQKLIRTPRLDQMAREGMRFTDHYAGAPLCAPSRCVLMTGKHTGHARIRTNRDVPLLPEDITIAEALKQAGYATGAFGKWGLGLVNSTGAPWRKGFDEFLGYTDQTHAHSYYPDHLDSHEGRVELPENRDGRRGVYSHDLFAEAVLKFIEKHKSRPFFLYLPFTIPHAEVIVPEDSLAEYRGKWPEPKKFEGSKTYCPQDQPRAVRAAMITRLDRDVGRILDRLDALKLSANTLVLFSSDNGPIGAGGQDPVFFDSNGPLRDLKFTLREGGIRVPFIARWPGRVPAGTTSDFACAFWDMFPTFAELAGAPLPDGLDGVSIVPTLMGKPAQQKSRDYLYWEYAPAQAIRQGHWKAYRGAPGKPVELYNLADDLGETRDVATGNPEIVAGLEKLMAQAHVESAEFPLRVPEKKAKKK